ncbi:helix-turn-helix domain-containing protein [Candidatus Enterococcus clewellii]|uniref:HTH cro/C1-type domain-containing protein n=1 Tax=Candidatus Enterococcus clewellii TaxID=1834193 RepID=A0A242K7W2_9ENTE|nr:hypothetical protein A5888_001391 [Enterococcus sp. 9E7_DIV0242]
MLFDRVKELAKKRDKSLKDVALELGFSENALYKWQSQSPKAETLQKVADYFDVSTDYLLGRTDKKHYYDLTEKDERDLEKELQQMIEDVGSNGKVALFSKDDGELDPETRELLIGALEQALRITKIEAKKRYTPKKYRGESYKEDKD